MKTDEALDSFVAMARKRRWKVSISRFVLEELLSGSAEKQITACGQLFRLAERLRDVFLIACSARQLWPLELDQCISAVLPVSDFSTAMSQIQHVALTRRIEGTDLSQIANTVKGWKQDREEKSVLMRAQGRAFFKQEGMTALGLGIELEKYAPKMIPDWILESAIKELAGRPSFIVKRIYRERDRFLSLRAWAALSHMVMFSDSIPPDLRNQHPITSWMKSDRNNWFDAGVAASAAYVDAFVTQDANLTKRCRWLRKRGCLTFETLTLEQLYARQG